MMDYTHMIHGLDKTMINMCHITLDLNIINDGLYSHDTWTSQNND